MNTSQLPRSGDQHSLEYIAHQLRIPKVGQELCTDWEAALQTSPTQARSFFDALYITKAAHEVGLTEDMIESLVAFSQRTVADDNILAFFSYCRHRVLHDPTLVTSWEEQWPPLDDYLGPDAGLLNVLVMLSAVQEMRNTYQRLGIPETIVRDTVADLRRWMETDLYYLRFQRYGITPWIARWLCKHWQARILQLGRLQFVLDTFGLPLRAFRNRRSRALIVFPESGQLFDSTGGAYGPCCGNEAGSWISSLDNGDGFVVGHPISGDGKTQRQPIRLDLSEWELELKKGDNILGVSIPVGGPLTHEACGESFRRALDVFPQYFPDFTFKGLWIKSWLLDPRFDGMLPPDSNIVRLQRELFLYPGIQGDNAQIYNRVFGWGVNDLSNAPRNSSLQKTVAHYLEKGGHFHGGYAFMMKEDFNWGGQVYRQS
jgi:hypothetical protein